MAKATIASEVAGSVWKILAKEGDTLQEDDTLLILESMKMEIPALAPSTGRVVQLLVAEGEPVREGQALAVLET